MYAFLYYIPSLLNGETMHKKKRRLALMPPALVLLFLVGDR